MEVTGDNLLSLCDFPSRVEEVGGSATSRGLAVRTTSPLNASVIMLEMVELRMSSNKLPKNGDLK